jgi:hypothetical protein
MTQAILVTTLRLDAVSGPTCYAGENGFSSVSGQLSTGDPEIARVLHRHFAAGEPVTVRCGLLQVTGQLRHPETVGELQQYAIQIQSASYGPPEPTGNGA